VDHCKIFGFFRISNAGSITSQTLFGSLVSSSAIRFSIIQTEQTPHPEKAPTPRDSIHLAGLPTHGRELTPFCARFPQKIDAECQFPPSGWPEESEKNPKDASLGWCRSKSTEAKCSSSLRRRGRREGGKGVKNKRTVEQRLVGTFLAFCQLFHFASCLSFNSLGSGRGTKTTYFNFGSATPSRVGLLQ